MGFLNRLSIVQKISIIPGIALLSFGAYLALTANIAKNNSELLHDTRDVQFPVLRLSDRLLFSLDKINELFSSAVTTADEEPLVAAANVYLELRRDLQEVSELAPSASTQTKHIDSLLQEYHDLADRLSRSMISGTADYARLGAESARMNSTFTKLKDAASSFQAEKLLEFQQSFDTANRSVERMVGLGLLVGAMALALLLIATIPLVLGIKKNLGQVVNSLRSIAEENGDLTVRLTAASGDEVGDLVFWFNSFMDKLQNVIKGVVEVSQPMGELAEQLNEVAEGANQSIDAQRKSTNSVSDAIESMSESIAAVADNAAHAASAASEGRERARGGQDTVAQTVDSIKGLATNVSQIHQVIHQLEEDSRRVGSVLDVIRSIADQTNLLALNAAIEAARAGEQGRGFAVVADEVRTLASKTQYSTAEIQETIERFQQAAKNAVGIMADSKSQAEVSVDNANKAGSSLQAIHDSIIDIDRLNESIANATHGQSRATQEIVTIISGIRDRSDQTADSSAKLRDVSTQLVALARQMSTVNQKFKV